MRLNVMVAGIAAALVLVFVVWVMGPWRGDQADVAARDRALAADSVDATRDTSRMIFLDDTVRVMERRIVQEVQRADQLDRLLGIERAARVQLVATVRSMSTEVKSDTVYVPNGSDERRGEFEVRDVPFTVRAVVALPTPPLSGRMNVWVTLDSVPLDVRIGCVNAQPSGGVREAVVGVASPPWASVKIGRVEQGAEVCSAVNRATVPRGRSLLREIAARFGATAGYAIVRESSGEVVAGPSVAVGIRIWP